jgi:hypothetical protein
MKTWTKIGAMILVLALFLCTIPVGAETETLTVIDDYVAYHLENDAPDAELIIAIWLPQADWWSGEAIPQYVGKIVTHGQVLYPNNADRLYAFLSKERDPDELKQAADSSWFIKEYAFPTESDGWKGEFYVETLSIAQIQDLIAKNPDAFIGYGYIAMEERLPLHHTGDANEDEVVDSRDARLALQYAVGKVTHPRFIHLYEADINGDNTVDSADARQILQKTVGNV